MGSIWRYGKRTWGMVPIANAAVSSSWGIPAANAAFNRAEIVTSVSGSVGEEEDEEEEEEEEDEGSIKGVVEERPVGGGRLVGE